MKILLISDLYPLKSDSTLPSVLEDFSLALKEKNILVEIVRPNFLFNTFIRGHKIFKSGVYLQKGIKIYNKNFLIPFLFNNLNLENDFDIIISHMPLGHIYADLINKKLNLPRISVLHYSDFRVLKEFKYSIYFKNKLKKALKNSTLIGARSEFLKRELKVDFILPSFIEKENIKEKKSFNSKKLKIITLSKLIKRKNLNLVIKALADVDFDFEYEIYGKGTEEKNLNKLIKKLNLQNKIKIMPHINHNLIYEKLDENDVFILPSIKETFGLSYLEAMSRGLITIGIKNEGIDGIIKNNENGFLINPNIKEIKEILSKINNFSLEKKEKISQNTLKSIKNYEKEKIITKYVETIKKILWK